MGKVLQPGEGVRQRAHVIEEKEKDGKTVEYYVRSGIRSKITNKFYDRRRKLVMIDIERRKPNVKYNDGRDQRTVKLTRRMVHPDPKVHDAAREQHETDPASHQVKL